MSDRPEKRKIEFIESYWTGGELGSDYQWNDNHGELVRCKDCKHYGYNDMTNVDGYCYCLKRHEYHHPDWFCADGEKEVES